MSNAPAMRPNEKSIFGYPSHPFLSSTSDAITCPRTTVVVKTTAPNFGARNTDMAMLKAPRIPPIQAHQGIDEIMPDLNHEPPCTSVMNPRNIVPTKKEMKAACIGLFSANRSWELTPACEARDDPMRKLSGNKR